MHIPGACVGVKLGVAVGLVVGVNDGCDVGRGVGESGMAVSGSMVGDKIIVIGRHVGSGSCVGTGVDVGGTGVLVGADGQTPKSESFTLVNLRDVIRVELKLRLTSGQLELVSG